MPRGDKDKYTDRQKRQAEHIEEGYRERGVSEGKPSVEPMRKGGRKASSKKR